MTDQDRDEEEQPQSDEMGLERFRQPPANPEEGDDQVADTSADSFPASDPPSWTDSALTGKSDED